MELEAVDKERTSLELQLAGLRKQMNELSMVVESQKTKVHREKRKE